jgi:hypothetical protein
MEFAFDVVINASQIGSPISEIRIILWPVLGAVGRRRFRTSLPGSSYSLLVYVPFLGIQVRFASLFLGMLGMSRGTFTGDYDLT